MKHIKLPSQARLLALFQYNPETGNLRWRHNPERDARWNNRFRSKIAGHVSKRGYVQVTVDGRLALAHRVIWKMLHNDEPPEVDHKDTNPSNNREVNLRASTRSQNLANRGARKGRLLPKGVVLTPHGRYCAQIAGCHIGNFSTPEEASAAFERAASERYGEFARAS